jgi:UDP-N-acetylglucosamine 1-carboxyvinyltransferase
MAACVASGTTTIENASIEPETLDLVKLLKSMGAKIEVDKAQRKIKVTGKGIESYGLPTFVSDLNRYIIRHTVIPDRIVAGTYAIAAAITGNDRKVYLIWLSNMRVSQALSCSRRWSACCYQREKLK